MLLVKTKLDVSSIDGIGLFADQFISAGTVVWEFNQLIDLRFRDGDIAGLAESAQEQIRKYSYREASSGLYVLCGDDARFFNHSETPNCIDIMNAGLSDVTRSIVDIRPGEELTCNYALFDLDFIEGRYQMPLKTAEIQTEIPR